MGRATNTLLLIVPLLLSACGGGSSGSGSSSTAGSGSLTVAVTDTPVTGAEKVVIHFTAIQVHGGDGTTTEIPIIDPVTQTAGRSIDLLQLQGDKSLVLFNQELASGNYSWMRLAVDFDPLKTYIQVNGQQHALRCTSCDNTGYKLNRSFEVIKDGVMAYIVDFDLGKSITLSNNGYHLRPTLRMVETAAAGHLSGEVDATLINSLGGTEGCRVYVYDGHDVSPDDIYLPIGAPLPENYVNPVATANVDDTSHQYMVGYLAAGNYTVSLTCDGELDDIDEDNSGDVSFYGTANITIEAGQTASHPFT